MTLAGCGHDVGRTPQSSSTPKPAPEASTGTPPSKDDHGHSHERGKMMLADAGKHHALLTAHLSPKGNELDLFFETSDSKSPKPVAMAFPSLKGFASRKGEETPHELVFEPAPADERPVGEKQGLCSHFVAKASWMKPTDELTVAVPMEIEGERFRVTWEAFNPKKFAHHEE
jgi:hypothetical protein